MAIRWYQRAAALLTSGAVLLLSGCTRFPAEFPRMETVSEQSEDGDRFKVNFFYQNNENTFCIRSGGVAGQFYEALAQTISVMSYSEEASRTYVLDYDPDGKAYSLAEYDRDKCGGLTWGNARREYSSTGKSAENPESFYVLQGKNDVELIDEDARLNGGILHLFTEEVKAQNVLHYGIPEGEEPPAPPENSCFDPEAVNLIFTDLSERGITYLGEDLFHYYTTDYYDDNNRYGACVLAIRLEADRNQKLYYSSAEHPDAMFLNASGDSRWYYLLMLGPVTKLAMFVQKLTDRMQQQNIREGTETGGYEISPLSFTPENFEQDTDILYSPLAAEDDAQHEIYLDGGEQALFETAAVRLEQVSGRDSAFSVGELRDNILEFRYRREEPVYHLTGYGDAKTKDFALNIDLVKEVESRDNVADSTELGYVFGKPSIYYKKGKLWTEMDPDHQERFFHKVSVDAEEGRRFTLIGDYADECDIHDLYITVPVLQKATVSNVVSERKGTPGAWVLNACTVKGSNAIEEVQRTYYFDKFYINLLNLKMEGERDAENREYEQTKDVYSEVGVLKLMLEDIH